MAGKIHLTEERRELTIKLARYIIATHGSMRSTEKVMNIGRTKIEWYIKRYLPVINEKMYKQILKIWEINSKDSSRKALSVQTLNRLKRMEKIKEYIVDKLMDVPEGECVMIYNKDISEATGIDSATLCGLMKRIMEEDEPEFERVREGLFYKYKFK